MKFAEWFEAQHNGRTDGPRAGVDGFVLTDSELEEIVRRGALAERVLAWRAAWDSSRESALYAWQAAQKK